MVSARLRSSATISGIISNLPYLPRELMASDGDAVVQSRLMAKAARTSSTAIGVYFNLPFAGSAADAGLPVNRMAVPPSSRRILAMLMIAMGRPTDAAARQTSMSRRLIDFFCKIMVGVAEERHSLSVIPYRRRTSYGEGRSAMLSELRANRTHPLFSPRK